jgi:tRNA threonylcarbamoyladenosine biosynthesis protein TsaE
VIMLPHDLFCYNYRMEKRVITTKNAEDTKHLGAQMAKRLKKGGALLLFGDLGSGKTTFTQGFAKELGIKRPIISPTFLIIRTYDVDSKIKLYHMDLYRIESSRDIEELGVKEIIEDPNAVSVIEWADKMGEEIPAKRIELYFRFIDENTREIEERIYGY